MRSKKKCRNCGRAFLPNKFNAYHQKYCNNTECRQASRKASKAKFRKAQSLSLDFRTKESERVKLWQSNHPGYWKKSKKRSKKDSGGVVLRDIALVEKLEEEVSALRDIAFSQHTVMEGVISVLTGDVLQDNIGVQRNRLYDRGKAISGKETEIDIINKIKQMRLRYETQSTNRSSPQA
jgi:hypothetical protein